ncbi:hypothetical protein INT47_004667 [Mucor saturninus]|uniref:Arrestin C-terminal-like domain-containing protein n=1 Tax=Mucor saturninus TaxID=64648 RepID=A0A8H7UUR6_9FUNG|nr:hypothetical protein INT47_004667 [Mucor saturninus]
MADLFKAKEREFYIELNQEKYFFPGDTISGDVVLNLTKGTKINNIKVTLDGTVDLGGRSISLFSKFTIIAQSPDGDKAHHLDAYTHRFPFKITIPTSEKYNVPSTLEISKLVEVSYRITATLIKPFVFGRYSAQAIAPITVLENINVESEDYHGDIFVEKELCLFGTEDPVKVSTNIGKRAAVKGDVIPIYVTVKHIGVMVRDKAISVQLLRSVYYGKNNSELYGPKPLKEVTANIEISGPVSFSKTFALKLTIPKNTCPTVDKSGQAFKIEYTLRVSVNLNEENPYRQEIPQDIVLFNVPFTIGTYPKLSFNIDDDDESDEDEYIPPISDSASNHSSELNEVTKTMQDMDLSEVSSPILQQDAITPLPPLSPSSKPTYVAPLIKSPPRPISVNQGIYKPNAPSPIAVEKHEHDNQPTEKDLATKPLPLIAESPICNEEEEGRTTVTPPPEDATATGVTPPSPFIIKPAGISPSDIFNDYNPGLSPTSPVQGHDSLNSMPASAAAPGLGRNKSFHLIVRNNHQEISTVSPETTHYGGSLPNNTGFIPRPTSSNGHYTTSPPQPSPSTSNHTHGGFAAAQMPFGYPPQPTPSMSNHTQHGFPPQPTPSVSTGYNGYPSRPPPQQNYPYPHGGGGGYPYTQPGFGGGMPEPQMNYPFGGPIHTMPMPQFGGMPSQPSGYPRPPSSYPYHRN